MIFLKILKYFSKNLAELVFRNGIVSEGEKRNRLAETEGGEL